MVQNITVISTLYVIAMYVPTRNFHLKCNIYATLWPGGLANIHFIFLAYAPEQTCLPYCTHVLLHHYFSLHIVLTILQTSVKEQQTATLFTMLLPYATYRNLLLSVMQWERLYTDARWWSWHSMNAYHELTTWPNQPKIANTGAERTFFQSPFWAH